MVSLKRIEKYGVMVWCDTEMDKLRQENCLCFRCYRCELGQCIIAREQYDYCKRNNIALMVTRCRSFVTEAMVEDQNHD